MITTTKTVAKYTVTDGVLDYSVPFPLYEAGDVLVLWSAAGGKESALALTNDYSVEIFPDGSGGTVTLLAGRVPAGATLALVSNIPETQELDLSHTAEVDTESLERELDRQVQMIQQHRSELDLCIKLNVTDNRTPEEVADELFEARDRAETAAKKAASSEDEAGKQADRAEDEADRAKTEADRAAQAAVLGVGAENLDAVWKLDAEIPAGETLELPLFYFAGRNMLHLSYDGVELYRGPQYEETGERDELSSSVKTLIPLPAGTVMHAWAVASNVARNVEEAEEQAKAEADRARREADRAANSVREGTAEAVKKAEAEADRAHDEADRAEKAAQAAELGAGALNADATWTLACPVEPGGDVILPVTYWPGRAMLYLSADRNDLFRGSDYLEIAGDGPEGRSDRVKSMCRLAEGTVMHAWVIASNVSRLVEEAERRAAEHAGSARRDAEDARESAAQAQDAAERAVSAAGEAELSRNVAQNAAQEATEQADRADEAAIDAGRYRSEALEAAKCAAASAQGRSIAAVQSADLLDRVPSGFFVINGELVMPGTVQHPLTPVDSVEDIPNMDGFFLLAPPFPDCPPEPGPEPEEPDKPDEPDEPGTPGGLPAWMLPCGKRARV